LLLLSLVATPEALTLTGAVLLALVISVTLKQAEYERNSLKGVKFTADGKMVIDSSNPQSSTQNQTLPSDSK